VTDPRNLQVLRLTHFLRDVPDEALESAAAQLTHETYAAGEDILIQGSAPEALYFLIEGTVELLQRDTRGGSRHIGGLTPGDTLGEVEVLYRLPRLASARATSACTLARWERSDLSVFVTAHPRALASLRFAAAGRRLASRLRFGWLGEGEVVYAAVRKHVALLYQALVLPVIVTMVGLLLLSWALDSDSTILGWVAAAACAAGVLLGAWQALDWSNDYYVVTNRRAVWIEKVVGLYDSRREAPLHMVLSVSLRTDAITRSLGYGDVIIRTYTGQLTFRGVGNPMAMAAMVEEHWRRLQHQRQAADREALSRTLQEQIGSGAAPPPAAAPLPVTTERSSREIGLDHWTLQMRFEQKGVITYRKHWAVLLQGIGLPSVLFLGVAGLLGASLSGAATLFDPALSLVVLAGLMGILALWWLYQYVDWANDIYQVTPTQIVDITRKPLGTESREVAPLENILGTEVDRKGLAGLLLNYGTVTAMIGTAEFKFQGVFDPVGVQQDIVRAQEAILARKHEKESGQRREEMVELLRLYEKEIASRRSQPQADENHTDDDA
jgi:Cyclic nucleotide-binding domain